MIEHLESRANACATRLREAPSVLVASHIDADGLASAGIAATVLERAGIETDVTFKNQLDENALEEIATREHDIVLFTDFGSGQLDQIAEHEAASLFPPVRGEVFSPCPFVSSRSRMRTEN